MLFPLLMLLPVPVLPSQLIQESQKLDLNLKLGVGFFLGDTVGVRVAVRGGFGCMLVFAVFPHL